jgi:putative DNA methylase
MRSVFSRHALSMTWDYAEANIFSDSSGSYSNLIDRQIRAFETLGLGRIGFALQADAANQEISTEKVISTDPPYYLDSAKFSVRSGALVGLAEVG